MKTKAVILAAGLGNRISAVAKDTPKPLLPLTGKAGAPTFLDWHLLSLYRAGCLRFIWLATKKPAEHNCRR